MGTTVRDQVDQEAEKRRGRFAGLLRTGAGTVGLLIAIVLLAQAGLVYVAVDQIGTGDETTIVPARSDPSPRAPISVDAEERERATAPTATRTVVEVEQSEGPPSETGLDRAAERADPQGVAPPLTGDEPPADGRDEAPTAPAQAAAEPEAESPGASEQAASESPSEAPASEDASTAPPSDEESGEEPDQGPGASGGEPPGHGGDNPGKGGGKAKGNG